MGDKKAESEIAQEIKELMQRRSITDTKGYLAYLKEQKETKRVKSEARMEEAELELVVIEKMKRGVVVK